MRSRYPHAAAAGVLWALAFPQFSIAGLAWVTPALLLAVSMGTRGATAFRVGFVAGLAHHLVSLYWLLLIPVTFFPLLGWLALSGFLALYPALWVWFAWRFWPGDAPPQDEASLPSWLPDVGWPRWLSRNVWMLLGAAAWVALEMARARVLGGFPWSLLGVSQYQMIPLIQVARIAGVYGVSFLVVWLSLGIFVAGIGLLRHPSKRGVWMGDLLLPLCGVIACFGWGLQSLKQPQTDTREIRIAVIQPSIPQTMIWDTAANSERFDQLLDWTAQALAEKPDVLLWPEAAVPELLRWHDPTYQAITSVARSNQVWMIIGADDAERLPESGDDALYYNSAWLINPNGDIVATYRKRQLVAFGEEVPFSRWLPFLKWLTPITGSFERGDEPGDFEVEGLDLHASPLICFEDVFPHLVRSSLTPETSLLVNLTNDGWFRESAAQWQHAATAVFRAVETGLPLVRSTNNGLTCHVDPKGRIMEVFSDDSGSVYGAGWSVFTLSVSNTGTFRPTVYAQFGDWFGWSCVAITGCVTLLSLARRSARSSGQIESATTGKAGGLTKTERLEAA